MGEGFYSSPILINKFTQRTSVNFSLATVVKILYSNS